MLQWVKNLIAVTQVTAEVQVQSLAWHSGLKDPALPRQRHRSQSVAEVHPLAWELPYATSAAIKLKKKKKERKKEIKRLSHSQHATTSVLHFPSLWQKQLCSADIPHAVLHSPAPLQSGGTL